MGILTRYRFHAAVIGLLAVSGCDDQRLTRELGETGLSIPDSLDGAADDFEVPVEVLAALADTESGLQDVERLEEFEGQPIRWGVMGIPDEHLAEAASLAGVSEDAARTERDANIAAAAALLSAWAREMTIDPLEISAWAPVVARYSGLGEDVTGFYVHDEVYRRVATGIELEDFATAPYHGTPDYPEPRRDASGARDRDYAVWRPSPNNSARPTGAAGDPTLVIIHTCEGSYTGCWGWLSQSRSGVSAHYVVNTDGSEVTQMVSESRKAWHVGARYDCDLNDGEYCGLDGRSVNDFSIGIEHGGSANQTSFSSGMLSTSAQLVCDITEDHDIPRDAYHIVGHGQLQPYNRIDPGPNWPWATYLADVRRRCGDGNTPSREPEQTPDPTETEPIGEAPPGTETIVIDSNNGRNMPGRSTLEVSSNWRSSANVRGFYNTGYYWRSTGPTGDGAYFRFRLDQPGCYSVDAWWPAGSDRSPRAPWFVFDADGTELDYVETDQRTNGGRWNNLGTYAFDAGWSAVALSRWAPAGDVVVADAVRIRPSSACGTPQAPAAPPLDVIVDSSNSANGTGTEVVYGSSWTAASSTPGFYGPDYVWHHSPSSATPLQFRFFLEQDADVSVETRWTAGANRSASAPFRMRDAAGAVVGEVAVDQRVDHATWRGLGTYRFTAGWNTVELVPSGSAEVVVADAVRLREVR